MAISVFFCPAEVLIEAHRMGGRASGTKAVRLSA
jgi:hypothetical protein